MLVRPVSAFARMKSRSSWESLISPCWSTSAPTTHARESILNAALRVRPDVPFACAGGVCGTCRAKVVTGSVTMDENYALEQDELDKGYVLTCQSHPTSKEVTVDFDV